MICAISAQNKKELESLVGVKSVAKANDYYYVNVDDTQAEKFVAALRIMGNHRAIQLDLGEKRLSLWQKLFGMKLFSKD